jgi:RNA polymerase sigma-70 factor (ECF subfamily)
MIGACRYEAQGPSAAPWLLGIARNKLLHSLRPGRVEQRTRERLRIEAMELDDRDLDDVERLADAGESRLTALLAQLPETEQHAIQARVVMEKSYSEVAAQLDWSELVVRKRVSRGLARLRRGLEKGH